MVRESTAHFDVSEGICRKCGFVYTNPCPDQESFNHYYGAKFMHSVGSPEYNMQNRIDHIQRMAGDRRTLLEVGAGEGSFLRRAAEIGFVTTGLDLIEQSKELDYGSDDPKLEQVELIVGSHMLEHVVDPGAFISDLRERLTPQGRIILEVPNLHLYGEYSSAVFSEHISHFSPKSLSYLLEERGFKVIDMEFSRPSLALGFIITAEWTGNNVTSTLPDEYAVNRAYFCSAANTLRERREKRKEMMRTITSKAQGKAIAFWGANSFLIENLSELPTTNSLNVTIVDANNFRWGQTVDPRFQINICDPATLDQNDGVSEIVICALGAAAEIRETLKKYGYTENHIWEAL